MIEDSARSTTKPRSWTRVAALLAVFAVSFLTVRLLAGRSAKGYPTPPFFHLFFSDTIHMKAWLATGAITLGLFQVLSAALLFELFRCGPVGRFWGRMHRMSGYLAILLTLPVAYHCIFLLGFETTSLRVAIHSILGSAFYGTFLVKVILVRSERFPGWALPVAGGLLFAILAALWLTSSLYLFRSNP
jgi:hypothetical protein